MNVRYESYLVHHGIKGMRWGIRRYQNPDGTLTPSGRKRLVGKAQKYDAKAKSGGLLSKSYAKKAAAAKKTVKDSDLTKARQAKEAKKQHEADKQKVLKEGNATEVLKYKKELTAKELNDAYNRINAERNLANISEREVSDGKKKVDSVLNTANDLMSKVDSARQTVEKGVNAYNTAAKIFNSLSSEKLPVLDGGASKKAANESAREKAKKKAAEEREKYIRTLDANKALDEIESLSTNELSEVTKRLASKSVLERTAEEERKKKKEE